MRVALSLGSGGARGYAHIGVINELRDRGHEIVGVAGSSMGALVGGLEAAGKLDEYATWASSLTQGAVLRLLDPSLTSAGVLRAEKILDAVREILGEVVIEDLPIPYTAVTTDLIAGRSVWLQRGPVDDAIRASIAIPGLIKPLPARWPPARRRRHSRPASDGSDRSGQRRPDDRREPRRRRSDPSRRRSRTEADGRAAQPDVAQHNGIARHHHGTDTARHANGAVGSRSLHQRRRSTPTTTMTPTPRSRGSAASR